MMLWIRCKRVDLMKVEQDELNLYVERNENTKERERKKGFEMKEDAVSGISNPKNQ